MTDTQVAIGTDREYETIFILRPTATKESSESISSRLTEVITREGGKLTRVENWGRRRLAYPVAKQKRGVYVYFKYAGGGGLVSEVERNLRMLDDVVKYQTVKVRDAVNLAGLQVQAEDVKFEHIEAPPDPEGEDSLARELGLEDRPDRPEHMSRAHGFDDAEMSEENADDEGGEGDDE